VSEAGGARWTLSRTSRNAAYEMQGTGAASAPLRLSERSPDAPVGAPPSPLGCALVARSSSSARSVSACAACKLRVAPSLTAASSSAARQGALVAAYLPAPLLVGPRTWEAVGRGRRPEERGDGRVRWRRGPLSQRGSHLGLDGGLCVGSEVAGACERCWCGALVLCCWGEGAGAEGAPSAIAPSDPSAGAGHRERRSASMARL